MIPINNCIVSQKTLSVVFCYNDLKIMLRWRRELKIYNTHRRRFDILIMQPVAFRHAEILADTDS